ncbi:zinc finger protein with KRAB and SCAN domains 1-like [Dendronephthya gigantea]|uniref:zinc finger protein with KRAB and SCAN domains 1-like n=1 Tax=Dendronephthya gigantea TaxID=151771 RepID=UPI00106C6CFA|nr:zinc finger protein with KRAB and SCAN domains 1-like [Dendronephthya gigantea]
MVIVSYVSRYIPALDTILTFPVVYHYTTSASLTSECIDVYNMTNNSTTSNGGVIIQRRPSVIKEVPKQEESAKESEEDETIDVVSCDEINGAMDGGVKMESDGLRLEGMRTRRRGRTAVEDGSTKMVRRKGDLLKRNGAVDDDWKPLDNKRHRCNECDMRFKKPSALVIHLRTHSGERPYSCNLCDKRFSISGNLRRHMFTHTGEKPYKCRACGRAFNNPSHLARHSKKIHI